MANFINKNYQSLDFILRQIRKIMLKGQGKGQLPSFLVYGHPGVGKSVGVMNLVVETCKETGIPFECALTEVNCKEPVDFLGRSQIVGDITVYAKPDFLPIGKTGGVLIIDEITCAHPDILPALKELLTNRSIGKWKLPDGWVMVFMGNPADVTDGGEQCDVKDLDAAFEGRNQIYYVKPDVKGFLKWFHKKYGSTDIYNFLMADNTAVNFLGKRGTPRDYERLQNVLDFEDDLDKTDPIELKGITAANIGVELANSFCDFRKLQMIVSAKDILTKDWAEVKANLETLRAPDNSRFDIEMGLCRNVPDQFFKLDVAKIRFDNLDAFCQHVGAERSVVIIETMNQQTLSEDKTGHLRKRMYRFIDYLKDAKSPVLDGVKDTVSKMKRD